MEKIKIIQYSIFGFTQICGLIAVFILVSLLSSCGGIDWSNSFNIHAFLMLLGMVYLHGLAISGFRILTYVERLIMKLVHAAIHFCVLALAVVALIAIHGKTESYSLHGIVGMITVTLFAIQLLVGFISFLYPKFSDSKRAVIVNYHRVGGAVIFALAILVSMMGISSYMITALMSLVSNQTKVRAECISAGLFTLLYGLLTVFIVRSKVFKPYI